jgi:hypothetical protein
LRKIAVKMNVTLIHKRGRPTTFQDAVAEEICERIAEGESVAKICKDDRMPALRTVWRWMREYPEFRHDYDDAKEACAEFYAQNILQIADDLSIPVNDRRLMIDARKWCSGRMKPKPQEGIISAQNPLSSFTDEELAEKKKALLIRALEFARQQGLEN